MNKLSLICGLIVLMQVATPGFASVSKDDSKRAMKSTSKANPSGFTPLPAKKSGNGVALSYRIEGAAKVGSPLTIVIEMNSPRAAQVTLRAPEELQLSAPDQVLRSQAGQRAQHTITVVPQAEGRFYLNLFSVANNRAGASAIAVQVGSAKATQPAPSGKVQVTPSGERIISVPAQ
jgi:hypothetical protein